MREFQADLSGQEFQNVDFRHFQKPLRFPSLDFPIPVLEAALIFSEKSF